MTKYLISFPAEAMAVSPEELPAVSADSHAVVREAKAAGVWVFGGGIDESVAPVRVGGDGTVTHDTYAQTRTLNGGFAVVECASRDQAVHWAARLAAACRCRQELREFMFDPES